MNEVFTNRGITLTFDDEGITCHAIDINRFYPYGSFKVLKLNWVGNLELVDNLNRKILVAPATADKQRIKEAISFAVAKNNVAENKTPVDIADEEKEISKDVQSVFNYMNASNQDWMTKFRPVFQNMIDSMSEEEIIIHALGFSWIWFNKTESITKGVIIITNKRFYYSGDDGQKVLSYMKSGVIELKDAHAVSCGVATLTEPAHVKFETKNDDYKITTVYNVNTLKARLEKGIKLSQESEKTSTTIVQTALSQADELKKFKELLDMGIISQEEFDAKKKQLLGL